MEKLTVVPAIEQLQAKLVKTELALNGGINVRQIFGDRIRQYAMTPDLSRLPQLSLRATQAITEVPIRLEVARPKIQEAHDYTQEVLNTNTRTIADIQAIETAIQNIRPAIESGSLDSSILEPFQKRLEEAKQKLILKRKEPKPEVQPSKEEPKIEVLPPNGRTIGEEAKKTKAKIQEEIQEAEVLVDAIRQRVKSGNAPKWHLQEAEKELARIKGEAPVKSQPKPEDKEKQKQKPLLIIDEQAQTVTISGRTLDLSKSRVGWEVLQTLARHPSRPVSSHTIEFVARRAGSTAQHPAAGAIQILRVTSKAQGILLPLITISPKSNTAYQLDAAIEFRNKEDLKKTTVTFPNNRQFSAGRKRASGLNQLIANYESKKPTTVADLTIAIYGKDDPKLRRKTSGQLTWIREDAKENGYVVITEKSGGHSEYYLEEMHETAPSGPKQHLQPIDARQVASLLISRLAGDQEITVNQIREELCSQNADLDSSTINAESLISNFEEGLQMIESDYNIDYIRRTWSREEQALWDRLVLLRQRLGNHPDRFLSEVRSKITGENN